MQDTYVDEVMKKSRRLPPSLILGKRGSTRWELRRHKGITTAGIGTEVLRRVPVYELTAKHRMGHATDFVFDGKQLAAGLRVDNVLEAVLIGIAFLSNEAMLLQERMWT